MFKTLTRPTDRVDTEDAFRVPKVREHPAVVSAQADLDRVRRQHATVVRELDELRAARRDGAALSTDEAADRMLAGEAVADPPVDADRERLRRRREVLRAAERKAGQAVQVAHAAAVAEIAESLIPRYRELQARMAPAVAALAALAEEEARFQRAMTEAGIFVCGGFSRGGLVLNGLDELRPSGRINRTVAGVWAERAREAYGVETPGVDR